MTQIDGSPEYVAAYEKVNAATKKFNMARDAFRMKLMTAENFCQQAAEMKIAEAEFDAAFTKEAFPVR